MVLQKEYVLMYFQAVPVSSHTGAGFLQFFEAVEASREQYEKYETSI